MRKASTLSLLAVIIALSTATVPAFAGDALAPAAGVLRTYAIGSYFYSSGSYDDSGVLEENPSDANAIAGERADVVGLNLGAALEMGILDWLSAYIQWTPGYTVWSDYAAAEGTTEIGSGILGYENSNINGCFDVTLGAQFRLVGRGAPLESGRFRVLAGPLAVIPLPNPDYGRQIEKAEDGGQWSINTAKHVFGLGARLSADAVITDFLFLNLLGDFTYHFPREKASYLDPTQKRTVAFGYTVILEIEPRLVSPVDPGLRVGLGLPVRMKTDAPVEIDGQSRRDNNSLLLTLSPSFTLYLDSPAVPVELELSYGVPLWGLSALNRHSMTFQVVTNLSLF